MGKRDEPQAERAPRFPIEIPLYFRRRGKGTWQPAMTDNMSRSGVLFRTSEELESGAAIDMHFVLPLKVAGYPEAVVACRGYVVRTVPAQPPDALPGFAATISRYRFVRRRGPAGA